MSIREGRTAWGEVSPRSWSHAAVGLGPAAALDCRCYAFQQMLLQKLGEWWPPLELCLKRNIDPPRITLANFFHKPEQETGTNSSYSLVKRTCWGYNVI